MTHYRLDTTMPAPTGKRKSRVKYAKLPLNTMPVDSSFLVPATDYEGVPATAIASHLRTKAARARIRVRVEIRRPEKHNESGVRLWRIG